jgi:hypothetical protein
MAPARGLVSLLGFLLLFAASLLAGVLVFVLAGGSLQAS